MLGRATPPIAVGLYARWGSGKSFMIFLLKQQFDPKARSNPRTHDLVQWFEDGYDALDPSMTEYDAQAAAGTAADAERDTDCGEKCAMLARLFGCYIQPPSAVPWGLLTLWALVDEGVRDLIASVHTWLRKFSPPTMRRVDACIKESPQVGRVFSRSVVVGTAVGAILGQKIGGALALEVSVDGFRFVNHQLAWTAAGALAGGLVAVCVGARCKRLQNVTSFQEQDEESSLPKNMEQKFEKGYIFVDFNAW